MQRLFAAGKWVFKSSKGTICREQPQCRPRMPRDGLAALNAVLGTSPGGLTAAELMPLLGHLSEGEVRLALDGLARLRLVDTRGDHKLTLRYAMTAKGIARLERERTKAVKRPVGRPRKYAIGEKPKRKYQPTGNPRGRPRKGDAPRAPRVFEGLAGRAPGRLASFDDDRHVRAADAAARYAAKHRRPRVRLRDMTATEREAYYERQRETARRIARSWRRWNTAARLAARHLAASPPEDEALSSYALEWLRRAS